MSPADTAYQSYLYMCRKLGCKTVLTQQAYEKAVDKLPRAGPNNIDKILSIRPKDK